MARTSANTVGHDAAGTISADVAAKLLMVTPEWIRRLSKDGWIAKTERGRYRVVDVVQGYIRFLKDEARRSSKTASQVYALTRLTIAPVATSSISRDMVEWPGALKGLNSTLS
jgi:predicted transcriptional regulator of viral defense system